MVSCKTCQIWLLGHFSSRPLLLALCLTSFWPHWPPRSHPSPSVLLAVSSAWKTLSLNAHMVTSPPTHLCLRVTFSIRPTHMPLPFLICLTSILISCGCYNKTLHTGGLKTTEIYCLKFWKPGAQNQGVGSIVSFWRLWGKKLVHASVLASSGC